MEKRFSVMDNLYDNCYPHNGKFFVKVKETGQIVPVYEVYRGSGDIEFLVYYQDRFQDFPQSQVEEA